MGKAVLLELQTIRAKLEEENRNLQEKQKNLQVNVSLLKEKVTIEILEKKQKELQNKVINLEAKGIKLESKLIKEKREIQKTEINTEPTIQKVVSKSNRKNPLSEKTKTLKNKRNSQIILSLGAIFAFVGLLLLAMYNPLSFFPWILLFFGLLIGAWGIYDLSHNPTTKSFDYGSE